MNEEFLVGETLSIEKLKYFSIDKYRCFVSLWRNLFLYKQTYFSGNVMEKHMLDLLELK